MQYEFHILLKYDAEYFRRNNGGDAVLDLDQHGANGWQVAAVTTLADEGGYAIILQRPIE